MPPPTSDPFGLLPGKTPGSRHCRADSVPRSVISFPPLLDCFCDSGLLSNSCPATGAPKNRTPSPSGRHVAAVACFGVGEKIFGSARGRRSALALHLAGLFSISGTLQMGN